MFGKVGGNARTNAHPDSDHLPRLHGFDSVIMNDKGIGEYSIRTGLAGARPVAAVP